MARSDQVAEYGRSVYQNGRLFKLAAKSGRIQNKLL